MEKLSFETTVSIALAIWAAELFMVRPESRPLREVALRVKSGDAAKALAVVFEKKFAERFQTALWLGEGPSEEEAVTRSVNENPGMGSGMPLKPFAINGIARFVSAATDGEGPRL